MWIIRALVLCLSFWFSTASGQEEAWWLTVTFDPDQDSYLSLKASDIDPEWVKLAVLSNDLMPKAAARDLAWMKKNRFTFSWEGDLDRNGLVDRVTTGVYKTRSGAFGVFLLVTEKSKSGELSVKYVHKEPGKAGFSVLRVLGKDIWWNTCILCGDFRRLVFNGKAVILR